MSEIVAHVTRNGKVESVHRGHIAVVTPDGELVASFGDPDHPTYIRSAAKPFQVMPLLESGAVEHYGLTDPELAVVIASHNGEPAHVEAVKSIHKKVGLSETDLQCGMHPPMHKPTAEELLQHREPLTAFHNNCSGKHSGMLTVAKFKDWPLETYLQPEHPVQLAIKEKIAAFSGLTAEQIHVGVDGCSAPVFYLPVRNMALMYARLAAGELPLTRRVFDLMWQNAELIAGRDRFDTVLMQATQSKLISKIGAEGIRCLGVRGERPLGIALKIEDGSKRATEAVVLEILSQVDLISAEELEELAEYRTPVIENHRGIRTGEIRANFELLRPDG